MTPELISQLALLITAIGGAFAAYASVRTSQLEKAQAVMQVLIDELQAENARLKSTIEDLRSEVDKRDKRIEHLETLLQTSGDEKKWKRPITDYPL